MPSECWNHEKGRCLSQVGRAPGPSSTAGASSVPADSSTITNDVGGVSAASLTPLTPSVAAGSSPTPPGSARASPDRFGRPRSAACRRAARGARDWLNRAKPQGARSEPPRQAFRFAEQADALRLAERLRRADPDAAVRTQTPEEARDVLLELAFVPEDAIGTLIIMESRPGDRGAPLPSGRRRMTPRTARRDRGAGITAPRRVRGRSGAAPTRHQPCQARPTKGPHDEDHLRSLRRPRRRLSAVLCARLRAHDRAVPRRPEHTVS
jgi:hypothetical protein